MIAPYTLVKEGLDLANTEEGSICWIPSQANPGDEIFLLEGCSLPIVLRNLKAGLKTVGKSLPGECTCRLCKSVEFGSRGVRSARPVLVG